MKILPYSPGGPHEASSGNCIPEKRPSLEIIPYFDEDALAKALSNDCTPPEAIRLKNHFKYLFDYLTDVEARSIVIEDKYISKDYLHDYATYYALCKKRYNRHCKRVHFFKTTISPELLDKALLEVESKETDELKKKEPSFADDYLGFIVVKPIPKTVIGFSVLNNYNSAEHIPNRKFWGTRNYKVHLFGRELTVYDSLAFQEQDSVLAACATTAVWSMLNVASLDPFTVIKSPSQITKDADNVSQDGSRLFPNKGLSILQICKAISMSGLDTELITANVGLYGEEEPEEKPDEEAEVIKESKADGEADIKPEAPAENKPSLKPECKPEVESKKKVFIGNFVLNQYLKKIINAYSPLRIPIILVISVPGVENPNVYHAITVSGFRYIDPQYKPVKSEISWLADNIDRFFAHDDQWGPFVKVEFMDDLVDLKTPWTENDKQRRPTRVTNIIVPVYPKVRISYADIEEITVYLDTILARYFDDHIKYDLCWDIKIEFSEKYKSEIKTGTFHTDEVKLELLKESMPKYIWVVKCYIGKFPVLEFTFDGTGVSNEMLGLHLFCNMPAEAQKELHQFLAINQEKFESEPALPKDTPNWSNIQYYRFMLKHLA